MFTRLVRFFIVMLAENDFSGIVFWEMISREEPFSEHDSYQVQLSLPDYSFIHSQDLCRCYM